MSIFRASIILVTMLLSVAAMPAVETVGSRYRLRIMPSVWAAQPRGRVGWIDGDSSSLAREQMETLKNMDLDDVAYAPALEIGISLPFLFDIHAGVFLYGADSNFTVSNSNPLRWADFSFAESEDERVKAEVEFMSVYAEAAARLIDFPVGAVSVGLALHGMVSDVTLDGESGNRGNLKEFAFVPALSARAFINPPLLWQWTLEAKLQWMQIDIFDVKANMLDASAQVTWRPIDNLGIMAGYRIVDYDLDHKLSGSRAQVDITLSGPYLGAVIQF